MTPNHYYSSRYEKAFDIVYPLREVYRETYAENNSQVIATRSLTWKYRSTPFLTKPLVVHSNTDQNLSMFKKSYRIFDISKKGGVFSNLQ